VLYLSTQYLNKSLNWTGQGGVAGYSILSQANVGISWRIGQWHRDTFPGFQHELKTFASLMKNCVAHIIVKLSGHKKIKNVWPLDLC
jgi:hypothetical protein